MFHSSDIPPHIPNSEHHDHQPPHSHPRQEHAKILPEMTLGAEDDSTGALNRVKEGEAVPVEVEAGH